MWKHLERGSSPIDWCEENYSFSPHIAEFINTISNVLFFVMPPFLMFLHKDYARHCGNGIHFIWVLLMVVGASSAYFHATLSLLGQVRQECGRVLKLTISSQLLDELAILWVVMACYWLWYPQFALPAPYKHQRNGRRTFSNFFILFALIVSLMGFIQPVSGAESSL